MWKKYNHTGFAIVLAWPETHCKQAGSWYDPPLRWIGINKNYYYKAGHAAIVLVNAETGKCHYFDFGRYHAPFQYGRVRDAETDHDLEIKTTASIGEDGRLTNYVDLLAELHSKTACHGSGPLHASYCEVHFEKAFTCSKQMQKVSPIAYGPFRINGTNCSRFVNTVVLAGRPKLLYRLLLSYPKTVSPTPLGNVVALPNYKRIDRQAEPLPTVMPAYLFIQ